MKNTFTRILLFTLFFGINHSFAMRVTEVGDSVNTSSIQKVNEANLIEIVNSDQFFYCSLEMKGSYAQHEAAFRTLYEEIGIQGLGLQDLPAGIYWNNPGNTPVEELKWELGIIADSSLAVKPPLKIKKWDYLLVAHEKYHGTFETEEENMKIKEVYDWISNNGFVSNGPLVRRFNSMPVRNENGQWMGDSEIIIPVQKKVNIR